MRFRARLIVLQPTPYCNINCSYCYLGDRNNRSVMHSAVVDAVAEVLIHPGDPTDEPQLLVWHGGEPTTVPIAWYERAYQVLRQRDNELRFSLQTNAVAINRRWIDLLYRTRTSVGVSIDGPRRFHDSRRLTRSGRGSFDLAMAGLRRLQDAGCKPSLITVLSPEVLDHAEEFASFYRDNGISDVSFSVDEVEGANTRSSFEATKLSQQELKSKVTSFIVAVMRAVRAAGHHLTVREVERIAQLSAFGGPFVNEQVEPWAAITVDYRGNVATFSPEFTEVSSDSFANFRVGNILRDPVANWMQQPQLQALRAGIQRGVEACRAQCSYFGICGGGAPVNKWAELGTLEGTETQYCRLTVQASADALLAFLQSN